MRLNSVHSVCIYIYIYIVFVAFPHTTGNLNVNNLGTDLLGDRGGTVVKVLHYNSEGRWFDPNWCFGIFH